MIDQSQTIDYSRVLRRADVAVATRPVTRHQGASPQLIHGGVARDAVEIDRPIGPLVRVIFGWIALSSLGWAAIGSAAWALITVI